MVSVSDALEHVERETLSVYGQAAYDALSVARAELGADADIRDLSVAADMMLDAAMSRDPAWAMGWGVASLALGAVPYVGPILSALAAIVGSVDSCSVAARSCACPGAEMAAAAAETYVPVRGTGSGGRVMPCDWFVSGGGVETSLGHAERTLRRYTNPVGPFSYLAPDARLVDTVGRVRDAIETLYRKGDGGRSLAPIWLDLSRQYFSAIGGVDTARVLWAHYWILEGFPRPCGGDSVWTYERRGAREYIALLRSWRQTVDPYYAQPRVTVPALNGRDIDLSRLGEYIASDALDSLHDDVLGRVDIERFRGAFSAARVQGERMKGMFSDALDPVAIAQKAWL